MSGPNQAGLVLIVAAIGALALYIQDRGEKRKEIASQVGSWYYPHSWTVAHPYGPLITTSLKEKFCGVNEVALSRLPLGKAGTSSWSVVLSVVHPSIITRESLAISSRVIAWQDVPLQPLILLDDKLSVKISRATLMTLFALTNARPIFSFASAAGYRSAYPSYCGQWLITWPIGKPCTVTLTAHDSHTAAADVYPPSFRMRVDRCIEMLAGIVSDGQGWKLAFPGRAKGPGPWLLRESKRGFPGAHGSRHLYNMMGGKVFEVDLLVFERCEEMDLLKLEVPTVDGEKATIYVDVQCSRLLDRALDCLPWSSLSWSLHRGLRDLLLAYGRPVMSLHRAHLAALLQKGAIEHEIALIDQGWEANFVHSSMGDMAASAVLASEGNSGDLVRIVVAIADIMLLDSRMDLDIDKDHSSFWSGARDSAMSLENMIALVKFFILEWSQELDYQLYHQLPVELYLV